MTLIESFKFISIMTRKEQLQYCKVCTNRKMSQKGLICALTEEKATFEGTCPSFQIDEKEAQYRVAREKQLEAEEYDSIEGQALKAGVFGGIAMIAVAVIWFVGGLMVDRIFFYPIVLLIIGVIGLIRGIADKNLAGEKNKWS